MGIVGLGRIGRSVAVHARAMKMRVTATELYPDEAFVKENGIELVDLDTLLKSADFISLHCPITDETRGMINSRTLALMRPEASLVNTARGGLVVEYRFGKCTGIGPNSERWTGCVRAGAARREKSAI